MNRYSFQFVLVLFILCLFIHPVFASTDIQVSVRRQTGADSESGPALLITPYKNITSLLIQLERKGEDGKGSRVELRPALKTGVENEVLLPHPGSRFTWEGKLEVVFEDESAGEMPLSFETARIEPLKLIYEVTREQILAGRVEMKADRDVSRAEISVYGKERALLGRSDPELNAPAGTPFTLSWKIQDGTEPLLVEVRVFDNDGFSNGVQWMPWGVSIPHDRLEFETNQAAIPDDQVHKLQSVLDDLNRAVQMHEGVVDVSLWIAGHTDTVGSRESNMRLSEARASSIAKWFRRAGIKVPIYYRGFGQESLLVITPENIDEPRNRRAEYVVAAEDPYAEKDLPGRWKRL